nr:hypothetical protein [Tanacetum cinerariifolium]
MKAMLALLKASSSSPQNPKTFQPKNKGLVSEIFNWDEEEVFEDEEVTQVKLLMALANDELTVRKSHARNGEWVDITIRKVNTLISINEDADWKNYLKDELLSLKQAKLDAVTFPIQNTELTKLNHALQEQLKEEKRINKKWLTSSKKVSQCISEQIPHQKKKLLEIMKQIPYSTTSPKKPSGSFSKLRDNAIDLLTLLSKRETRLRILYYMICKREDHRTSDHEMNIAFLKRSKSYKAQHYQYASSSKQILKVKAKPFPQCTHCSFNNHRPNYYRNYPECKIYRSYDYSTSRHNHVIHIRGGVLAESSQSNESSFRVKYNTCGSTVHSTSDHNEFDHFKRGKKI